MPINSRLLHDSIRQRIKNLRTAEVETRLSQAELGKVLGLNRSTIANIESGLQRASLHHIY
ncbi:MAG: helix-turn-helix domain-containing protein, partial [Proteobacteria bacterium]|nr:helix-turn-helix domain-containing protein [Pseudomonadota bacterium]